MQYLFWEWAGILLLSLDQVIVEWSEGPQAVQDQSGRNIAQSRW